MPRSRISTVRPEDEQDKAGHKKERKIPII